MNNTLSAALSFALLATTPHTGPTMVRFAPADGTVLSKRFESSTQLEFASMEVVMNGQQVPAQFLPEFRLTVERSSKIELTDRYVSVKDGRPRTLSRTFDSLEEAMDQSFGMTAMGQEPVEQNAHATGKSDLEGQAVRFVWSDDSEEYDTAWADGAGDDALLAGLAEDTDLRGLLPGEGVDVGDSWKVDAGAFHSVLEPGGDLGFVLEGENVSAFDQGPDDGPVTGEAELRLAEVREVEGARVALITFEGRLETRATSEGDLADVPVADGDATTVATTTHELGGELRWDLDSGVLHAFHAESEVTLAISTTKDPGQPGPDFQSVMTLTGRSNVSVSARSGD